MPYMNKNSSWVKISFAKNQDKLKGYHFRINQLEAFKMRNIVSN